MSNQTNRDMLDVFAPFILLGVLIFGSWFLLRPYILHFLFWASPAFFKFSLEWIPSILIPHADRLKMASAIQRLPLLDYREIVKKDAWHYTWMTISLWGTVLRLVVIPAMAYQTYIWFVHMPARLKYKRVLSLQQLTEQNSKMFPCVLPALRANLAYKDPFIGKWKYPQSAIEFVMDQGLLVYKAGTPNMRPVPPQGVEFRRLDIKGKRKVMPDALYTSLDIQKCDQVMIKQLGKRWNGVNALPPLERALAICFMAASVGGTPRKEAYKLLDQISRSFKEADEDEHGNILGQSEADLTGIDELYKSVEKHPHVNALIRGHAYEKTVFFRLLDARNGGARAKGKLPPKLFHWLKPHNEDLWRLLHKVGAQEPWAEALAPWIHYHCEIKWGRPFTDPIIESCASSLIAVLHSEEWIYDKDLAEAKEREEEELLKLLQQFNTAPATPGTPGTKA